MSNVGNLKPQNNKPLSIVLITLGGLGIVLGTTTILYAVYGANAALDVLNVDELQEDCRKTFSTYTSPGWNSIDTGECKPEKFVCPGGGRVCKTGQYCSRYGFSCIDCPYESLDTYSFLQDETNNYYVSSCPNDSTNVTGSCIDKCHQADRIEASKKNTKLGTHMCGLGQMTVGCSYESYRLAFKVGTAAGTWGASIGSFFVIVASIPVLANGLHGFFNNEILARVSGGFGVAFSVMGFCGAFGCVLAAIITSLISKGVTDVLEKLIAGAKGSPCSPECQKAAETTGKLGHQVSYYFQAITGLLVALFLLAISDIVVASVSCCFWKRKQEFSQPANVQTTTTTVTKTVGAAYNPPVVQTVQPVVISQPAPALPVAAVSAPYVKSPDNV